MNFSRRSILPLLLSPFAAMASFRERSAATKAVAKAVKTQAAPGMVSEADIDALVEAASKGGWVEFRDHRVLWTGWKSDMATIDRASQWLMAPLDKRPPYGDWQVFHRVFCISCPGYSGLLNRGEAISLTYSRQQVGFGIDIMNHGDGILASAQRLTGRILIEAMRGGFEFDSQELAQRHNANINWKWERLSWQSRFYLHPEAEIFRSSGITPGHRHYESVFRALFDKAYGIAPLELHTSSFQEWIATKKKLGKLRVDGE